MVAKKPVSINWQMIFVLIPLLDLYASYRIQKLRFWLLIFLVGNGIIGTLMHYALFGPDFTALTNPENMDTGMFFIPILYVLLTLCLAVFIIRKWSISWNKKFD